MKEARIVRHGDKEAVMFTTPSGVHAVIATSISRVLLLKLKRKLERKIRRAERSRAIAVLGNATTKSSM
ncbi:MAG: hypothetical protein ABI702_16860 [Burkholderiales bacterium]